MRNKLIITTALTAALALTGCAGMTEKEVAVVSGIGGAVVGGVLGKQVGDNRGRNVGAVLGAAAGAAIGYHEQKRRLEEALAAEVAAGDVTIRETEDAAGNPQLSIDLGTGILFASNSADLSTNAFSVVERIATVLRDGGVAVTSVVGHADSTGSEQYNQLLSERRAQAVADELALASGAPHYFTVAGAGERRPIASNATPEGRAKNRRVEVTLRPVEQSAAATEPGYVAASGLPRARD